MHILHRYFLVLLLNYSCKSCVQCAASTRQVFLNPFTSSIMINLVNCRISGMQSYQHFTHYPKIVEEMSRCMAKKGKFSSNLHHSNHSCHILIITIFQVHLTIFHIFSLRDKNKIWILLLLTLQGVLKFPPLTFFLKK